jgi:ABC-type polysaccharide/polyol phosphate export permease
VLLFAQGFCGLLFGLFISAILVEDESIIQAALGVLYILSMMNGVLWPIEAQPDWLKMFTRFFPLSMPCDTFRNILEKGTTARSIFNNYNFTNFLFNLIFL